MLDARPLQSTPESGARADYDGAKRRKGSKVRVAVDTLGHLLAAVVTPANETDRGQVAAHCERVQQIRGQKAEVAYANQGYTGKEVAAAVHLIFVGRLLANGGFHSTSP